MMKAFLMKFLFLSLISSKIFAEEYMHIQLESYSRTAGESAVVEVLGTGKGSGVPVILHDKIVIVTNSHNLQGKESARINYPETQMRYFIIKNNNDVEWKSGVFNISGSAKVLYDFPLSDVAILDIPENLSEEQKGILCAFALNNGVLSEQKGWQPGEILSFGDHIAAVLQGKRTTLKALEGFNGIQLPDTFISGDKEPIWIIPVFAKPGVSGGGYYQRGRLTGLVTKISLAGEPIAFATPFTKIAKLIYSKNSFEKKVSWHQGLLVYQGKDKTITLNPLGNGWIGNGGELTEVDESVSGDSNPNYWRLDITSMGSRRTITTWDPFVYRPGQFKVNQDNISFVKVKDKGLFKSTETYRVPTLASFLANEKSKDEQTFYNNSEKNLAILKEARLKRPMQMAYGRLYLRDLTNNNYQVYDIHYGSFNGAQALYPKNDKILDKIRKWNPLSALAGPKPLFNFSSNTQPDADGYLFNLPFAAKASTKDIFDIKLTQFLEDRSTAYIKAGADLSSVNIRVVDGRREKEIVLNPAEFNSPTSMVYKSDDEAYRAIFIYANDDLTTLVRIYIVSESAIIELWQ